MLVFCRKRGEQFVIGNNVTVSVQRVQGKRVWLTFDAPASVTILRHEVALRKQAEAATAATTVEPRTTCAIPVAS